MAFMTSIAIAVTRVSQFAVKIENNHRVAFLAVSATMVRLLSPVSKAKCFTFLFWMWGPPHSGGSPPPNACWASPRQAKARPGKRKEHALRSPTST